MEFRVKGSKWGDLTGKRFGRWLVLRKGPGRYTRKDGKSGEFMYWCRCDCGNEKYVKPMSLYTGDSKSCGCLRAEIKAAKHLIGFTFGNITVLERTDQKKGKNYIYKCLCKICGKEFLSAPSNISSGNKKSCGCIPKGARLERGEGGFNLVVYEYTLGAKKRGLSFVLSREEIRKLTSSNCYYCGREPSQIKISSSARTDYGEYIYNGIDRISNDEGYIIQNCVPCCSVCNFAKSTMAMGDFIEMAQRIAKLHPTIGELYE